MGACCSAIFKRVCSMAKAFTFFPMDPFIKEILNKVRSKLKTAGFNRKSLPTRVASRITNFMAKLLRKELTTYLKGPFMEEPEKKVSWSGMIKMEGIHTREISTTITSFMEKVALSLSRGASRTSRQVRRVLLQRWKRRIICHLYILQWSSIRRTLCKGKTWRFWNYLWWRRVQNIRGRV